MKRIIAIAAAVLMFSAVITVTSAKAGSARRHTIEGFILGTGAAIIGAAIIHEINKDSHPKDDRYRYHRHHGHQGHERYGYYKHRRHKKDRHHKRYAGHKRGHWEVEKIWIAPVYEEKWNPGHYNRRGKWINGRYEKFMVQEGYWSEKKIWIWH